MSGSAAPLNNFQRRNLAAVCSIGAERLTKVADTLDQAGFVLSKPAIDKQIYGVLGETDGQQLSSFLFGLSANFRHDDTSPADTMRMLSRYVSSRRKDDPAYDAWDACEPIVTRLLSSASVRLTSKALDISYDFERLFVGGRFVTSIRPVFDETREHIVGGAIVQTLRLAYLAGTGEENTLSIALDRADIVRLMKSCEVALAKGQELAQLSSDRWGLPTMMSNDGTEP